VASVTRRTRTVAPAPETSEVAKANRAAALRLTAHAAIGEFLSWLRRMPSISELRVTRGDEGPTVWAIQDVENLPEAHEAYVRVSELLARDDTPYFDLYVSPRSKGTETTLVTGYKL